MIQAAFPVQALLFQPGLRLFERARGDLLRTNATHFARLDQAAVLQHIQVLGKRRQGHVEGTGEFGDRGRTGAQTLQDGAAGGVGQALKYAIELRGLVRHWPKYARS